MEGFSAVTRDWFTAAFAAPTEAQVQAWAAIGKGENTLVIAPTGSGKTLAAFLWALDRLAAAPTPSDAERQCRVLYISPLKALAVDIERNLRAPLTGIRHTAQAIGSSPPDIQVAVRTGDSSPEERRRLAAHPPDILITTPESLFLLLTSKARDVLRGVDTVIVDEVHALAGSKRGAHLALSLERLDALEPGRAPAQRIGPAGHGGRAAQQQAAGPAHRGAGRGHDRPGDGGRPGDPGRAGAAPVHLAARGRTGARPDRAAPVHDRVRQLTAAG
jgi:ATP-dependent Lhr-like helicase